MYVHNAIRFIQASKKCWIRLVESINFDASTVCNKPSFRAIEFSKGAAGRRFFIFTAGLTLCLFFLTPLVHAGALCQDMNMDARVRIEYVIDGDTVVLTSGEKLRLIGIDTPEMGYRGKAPQPGAVEARKFIKDLVQRKRLYPLKYGIERHDRHGRRLGHLFLEDGINIQAMLLAQRYATPLNIPPNLYFSDCYDQQAALAMNAKIGIWKLEQYQSTAANRLTAKDSGYRIIHGRVTRVGNSASSLWLNLDRQLAIRIRHDDLKHFPGIEPGALKGRRIEVRGMLYTRHKQLRLRLRQHLDLKILKN